MSGEIDMAALTSWKNEDLAELTELAQQLSLFEGYCENCQVVQVEPGDIYCAGCVEEIVEYLALHYWEQGQVEEGLY